MTIRIVSKSGTALDGTSSYSSRYYLDGKRISHNRYMSIPFHRYELVSSVTKCTTKGGINTDEETQTYRPRENGLSI